MNLEIFGRHRIRATFYHIVATITVFAFLLWTVGILSDHVSVIITTTLFFVDYFAEMYDPHPDNPGPWFKRHFHRFFDNNEE